VNYKLQNFELIESLNQRGGSMLTWDYLVSVGTIPEPCIKIIENAMNNRESFLVGAKPGAAGKTTIMGAMLSLRPDFEQLEIFTSQTDEEILKIDKPKCYVVHEIGSGNWFGYVWNRSAEEFLKIPKKNPNLAIAGNLHCDTIDEVKQTIKSFGTSEVLINNIQLLIFLEYNHKIKPSRRIKEIWRIKNEDHEKIYISQQESKK
jgi:hypothetical protein